MARGSGQHHSANEQQLPQFCKLAAAARQIHHKLAAQAPPASEAMLVAAKERWSFMRCSGDCRGSAAHRLCCKEGASRLLRGSYCVWTLGRSSAGTTLGTGGSCGSSSSSGGGGGTTTKCGTSISQNATLQPPTWYGYR